MKIIGEYNISFKCNCFVSGFDEINIIDLCVLVGNLLDNAIEACQKIDKQKRIQVSFKQEGNFLNVIIKNTYIDEKNNDLLTTKDNKLNHGYGIKSVRSIVEKYEGTFKIIKNNGYFIVSVLLKNVKDKFVMS